MFRIILKNGKDFNVSTDQSILKELMELSGVKFVSSKPVNKDLAVNVTKPTIKDDSEFFLKATKEVEAGNQKAALWAKAMALREGNESKAKYKYINLRTEDLISEVACGNEKTKPANPQVKELPKEEKVDIPEENLLAVEETDNSIEDNKELKKALEIAGERMKYLHSKR